MSNDTSFFKLLQDRNQYAIISNSLIFKILKVQIIIYSKKRNVTAQVTKNRKKKSAQIEEVYELG